MISLGIVLDMMRKCVRVIMIICYITLVVATLMGIVARTLPFFDGFPWGMELSRFAMVWLVMFINSLNIKERDEIVIEVLISRVPDMVRKVLAIISDILVIAFLVVMFRYGCIVMMSNVNQTTATLGISMRPVYFCMPAGAFFMLVEKILVLIQDIRAEKPIKNAEEEAIDRL